MAKKDINNHGNNFRKKEIQTQGNNLLRSTLSKLRTDNANLYWSIRSEEDQEDIGIDFQVELLNRENNESIEQFKIQNKGTDKSIKPLVSTDNKGKISFQLDIRNAEYYRYQLRAPMIFTLCDLKSNNVYWHPIQLDDSIDERLEIAKTEKKKSIQIYINPENIVKLDNVKDLLNDIKRSVIVQIYRCKGLGVLPLLQSDNSIEINCKQSMLEQLHEFNAIVFDELDFIPIQIFKDNCPFKLEQTYYTNYSKFSVSTDNKELFAFIESLNIGSKGITFKARQFNTPENIAKIEAILTKWSYNLIFSVQDDHNHKTVQTRFLKNKKCDCANCSFYKLQLSKVFENLTAPTNDLVEKVKQAHLNYQVCNFVYAAQLLFEIKSIAKSSNKILTHFIASYNLKKLIPFLRSRYWGVNSQHSLIKKIEKIDLDAISEQHQSDYTGKIMQLIKDEKFFIESKDEIDKILVKIRNHYYSQLYGGYSSNEYVVELLNKYAEIESFINKNYIVFDKFLDFNDLTEKFIEGIMAAHAISNNQDGHLHYIDDWIIHKLVFHGDADTIIRYFNRYNLKELIYKRSSTEEDDDDFLKFFRNFFTPIIGINDTLKEIYSNESWGYSDEFESLYKNLMVVATICKLNAKQANEIANVVLRFFKKSEKLIRPINISYVSHFLSKQHKLIETSIIAEYLTLFFDNEIFHDERFIDTISSILLKRKHTIKLSNDRLKYLMTNSFEKCCHCHHEHSKDILIHYYEILVITQQQQIKNAVSRELKNNYSNELFYMAAIYDVIGWNEEYFNNFLNSSIPKPNSSSLKSVFTGKRDALFSRVGNFINLAYKYRIDLKDEKYDCLRKINPYYDWLLDLSGFDYNHFYPEWIKEYNTKFYYEEFRRHPIIKTKLTKYLKKNHHPYLEKIYFDLYA